MTAGAIRSFPARAKMFTFAGNLTVETRGMLEHIRGKHPLMQPEPPLDAEEIAWLREFVDEWAARMERGLLSRKLLRKYKRDHPLRRSQ